MSFWLRVLAVGTATFAFVALFATLVAPWVAPLLSKGTTSQRARRLAILRLTPTAAAAVIGLLAIGSFLDFEPRRDENIGWMIPLLGGLGAVMISAAIWRAARIAMATRRLTRAWLASGEPIALDGITAPSLAITSTFPVVAVVGVRRPRLVIARSVLSVCTPDELQAVLAHEQCHIDRRDNLRRLLMYAAPDALAWLPRSSRLASSWRATTEEAADDEAARMGDGGRLALASALVKVARLAAGMPPQPLMPASTLYCGESIDARVRRLLGPADAVPGIAAKWHPVQMAAAIAGLIAISLLALRTVQALLEATIHILP